jgi:hypothetical protein
LFDGKTRDELIDLDEDVHRDDGGDSEGVDKPFVEEAADRAGGLPMYVELSVLGGELGRACDVVVGTDGPKLVRMASLASTSYVQWCSRDSKPMSKSWARTVDIPPQHLQRALLLGRKRI